MKCYIDVGDTRSTFYYDLDVEESGHAGKAVFAHRDFRIEEDLRSVHPDIMVLIAILGAAPWIGERLDCNIAVSSRFSEAVAAALSIRVDAVDPEVSPRCMPPQGRVGLAYSGGADCSAALAVLPENTGAYFLDRIVREGEQWKGLYSKAAAYHACNELSQRGYLVRKVRTDLEMMRQPVGFPDDLANIIPALCFADCDDVDAIGWGAVLESTYRIGAKKFRGFEASPIIRKYRSVFAAVGLGMANAVAGVSEVGTAIISNGSGFGEFAQSCMRGDVGSPCRKCWKCTRKVMLDSSLTGVWPTAAMIDELCSNREASMRLTEEPIKHEGVVAFAANRYPSESAGSHIMGALREKLASYDVEFLQRHYAPALEFMPARYREAVAEKLDFFLGPMTRAEESFVRDWNVADHESERRAQGQRILQGIFNQEGE